MDHDSPSSPTAALPPKLPPSTPTSVVLSILRGNTEVEPQLRGELERSIASSTEGLARYDKRKLPLSADEGRAREALWYYRESCDSALRSPIRRLPNELLASVFELAGDEGVPFIAKPDGKKEITRLGRGQLLDWAKVCARWHDIVLHTPSLWSHITINIDLLVDQHSHPGTCETLLLAALERSQNLPLRVRVSARNRSAEHSTRLLRILADQAGRWTAAALGISPSLLESMALKGKLPRLQKLFLHTPGGRSREWLAIDSFSVLPSLQLFSVAGNLRTIPTSLPWGQLMEFMFYAGDNTPTDVEDFASLPLKFLRRGASVSINTKFFWHPAPPNPEPLTVTITSLDLALRIENAPGASNEVVVEQILSHLELPQLKTLSIGPRFQCPPEGMPAWSYSGFADLARRSQFAVSLVKLSVLCAVLPSELLQSLEELPVLEELHLKDIPSRIVIDDDLLQHLQLSPKPQDSDRLAEVSNTQRRLIPRLGILGLAMPIGLHVTMNALRAFVENRIERGEFEGFFNLRVDLSPVSSEPLQRTLRELVEQYPAFKVVVQ
ncbi:F-box domain-containing protein [Mycena chlorophos]|uniref:F-box domain-containing protein n=1 Tax=Mycena chlorophos TaxID=658473 RepID=A0A8H6TII9_MYCCL|nr:F-box domain-containing protein [Mycena chlorophos]